MKTELTTTPKNAIAAALPFDASIVAGQCTPSTIAMYRRDFAAYAFFAGSRSAALDPATLARWRQHLAEQTAMSPNTINRMLSAVRRIVSAAAEQGLIEQSVATGFAAVKGVSQRALKDRIRPNNRTRIEPADMRRIVNCVSLTHSNGAERPIGYMHRALLLVLASAGLRISEAITLTPGQIRHGQTKAGKRGWYVSVVGKTDIEAREAPISTEAKRAMDAWLSVRPVSSGFIFTGISGRGGRYLTTPITAVSAWQMVQRYAEDAGLAHIKPHDLRRFVGTTLAAEDIRLAQKVLGHKSIETTARHYVLDETPLGVTDGLF